MASKHVDDRLSAYLDGEIDATERRGIAAHLAECAACTAEAAALQALRERLHVADVPSVPPGLEARVRQALRDADRGAQSASAHAGRPVGPARWRPLLQRYGAIAAAMVLTAALSSLLTGLALDRQSRQGRIEHDLLTAHLRALAQDGNVQVASSDSHQVRPWFAGKVDFAPEAPDLADKGFELVGGRLDIVDNRRIGAVIYRRRLHLIDIFAWPSGSPAPRPPEIRAGHGYNLVSWSKAGVEYWAVSDLDSEELKRLAMLL